jgi:HK97 family phage major capsid protein
MTVTVGPDRRTLDPGRGFQTPGDFLASVRDAALRSERTDERLRPLAAAGSDEQGEYSDPHGGFLVPPAGAPFVLNVQDGGEEDPAAGRTLPVPMSAPIVQVSARTDKNHSSSVSGGLRVYRLPEAQDGTISRQQFDRITLEAHEAVGLTFASTQLATDSFPSFSALLGASYRDEFNAVFLEERLRGTGTGEFTGILSSPALIVVSKELGQANDTIVGQNIQKMRKRCWGYRRAVWMCNHDAIDQVQRATIDLGAGILPVWTAGDGSGSPDLVLGRPLIPTEACSTVGDRGDLILVNWSQYLDGEYQPVTGLSSIHVRYLANEVAYRFWTRNDGAPWWRSALTPRHSNSTLSPFVTLEDR